MPHKLESGFSSSLSLRHSDDHLTCFTETEGDLSGGMHDEGSVAGGRARGRSGRQLLGHCLPGVCTSVISQPLSLLASYRHTRLDSHTPNLPNTHSVHASPPPPPRLSACLRHAHTQQRFVEPPTLYKMTSCHFLADV